MVDPTQRVSVSLPGSIVKDVDRISRRRGENSRSSTMAELLRQGIDRYDSKDEATVMAGTITLVYTISRNQCQAQLAKLQRKHLDEVISSLHVQLEDNHVMEVMIVQGPAGQLRKIADQFIKCKGVKSGQLTLSRVILPPLVSRILSP
jgi:CopG family transcriptional regulator, nickel-responsive regulator